MQRKCRGRPKGQQRLPLFEQQDRDAKIRNYEAIVEAHKRRYPMTDLERSVIPQGVRLARFIRNDECENCNFATLDHMEDWKWPAKVCLKDVRRLKAEPLRSWTWAERERKG